MSVSTVWPPLGVTASSRSRPEQPDTPTVISIALTARFTRLMRTSTPPAPFGAGWRGRAWRRTPHTALSLVRTAPPARSRITKMPQIPTPQPGDRWRLRKPAVTSRHGLVAAQQPEAAQAGAAILARGGNAIDAAIATAFALGATEPWMSGIGGGRIMLIYRADERQVDAIDYTVDAPKRPDPARYPPTNGVHDGMFGWASLHAHRNPRGFEAMSRP